MNFRKAAVVICVLGFFAIACGAAAEPLKVGQPVPRFEIKDVMGRLIPDSQLEGWIVIYGFGDEKSADEAVQILKKVAVAEPRAEGILYVCVADTSSHDSKILRPLVKKILKKEYRKNVNEIKKEYEARGVTDTSSVENRVFLIADMKSDIFKSFGIENQRSIPQMFMVDGKRNVRAYYANEYDDKMVETLRLMLSERETEKKFALTMGRKKKSTWKWYLLGGAALWVAFK